MSEPLTRDQFRIAVADAVGGVLNVYREVDAMMRELGAALGDGEPRFTTLIKRLVPGSGTKNPDARYLRNYHAAVFGLATESDDEEDEEEDDSDEEDEEEVTSKRTITLTVGGGIVVARAAIYERGVAGFEPSLIVASLTGCSVGPLVPPGTDLKVGPSRFKKVVRALDLHRGGKVLKTSATAVVVGAPKGKHKVTFDVTGEVRLPLFEVTPEKVVEIAQQVRAAWPLASA